MCRAERGVGGVQGHAVHRVGRGGQNKIRGLWHHYFHGCEAVIFVVDSSDRERVREDEDNAKEELDRILEHPELKKAVLLVYANKQDLPGALTPDEVKQQLGLNDIPPGRVWHLQAASAVKGEGLTEGLDWLINAVTENTKNFNTP